MFSDERFNVSLFHKDTLNLEVSGFFKLRTESNSGYTIWLVCKEVNPR